jgi:alpha-beta hydrolase superfamily lysophospholipase
MLQELTRIGLPTEHKTLYAGHSVGGAIRPYIIKDQTKLPVGFNHPDGMILMASFLVRAFRSKADFNIGPGQYSFPNCPVLSIGAELDGLARLPRMAEAFYNQILQSADPVAARKSLPVTMIEGMFNTQFAFGAIPSNAENRLTLFLRFHILLCTCCGHC